MLTSINNQDDLSYVLCHKSMNGLKNCIEITYYLNELYNKIKKTNDISVLNATRLEIEHLNREYQN